MATDSTTPGIINTPSNFHFGSVEFHPKAKAPLSAQQPLLLPPTSEPQTSTPSSPQAPLGVLSNFAGTFAGTGFNTIFRPNSGPPNGTTFPNPVSGNPIPQPPNENVLELNLTTETISFATPLGNVPNRGLGNQQDITLNGVPYVQVINDVTNVATGKADATPTGIHFEPGLWMNVPATTSDPVLGDSLVRMASIPHGTTINAQCLSPTTTFPGPPKIAPVDITPFVIGSNPPTLIPFAAQTATKTDTPRLPQDLSPFIATGTITQDILTDPNTVLRKAIAGQTITNTIVFTVSTNPPSPELGGGTANIAFLEGTGGGTPGNSSGPAANADAVQMTATFWIETVEHVITIPIWHPGQPPLHLSPTSTHIHTPISSSTDSATAPTTNLTHLGIPKLVPQFLIEPPHAITAPKTIKVHTTQIQYSQVVNLNFAGLTWPHVSVATLIPAAPQKVPGSVWN